MKETITIPFESMPRLITGSFLSNDQEKKLKDTFKDFTVVVRCKDCKHIQSDGWCKYHRHSEKEEWYCADGERKEESK